MGHYGRWILFNDLQFWYPVQKSVRDGLYMNMLKSNEKQKNIRSLISNQLVLFA